MAARLKQVFKTNPPRRSLIPVSLASALHRKVFLKFILQVRRESSFSPRYTCKIVCSLQLNMSLFVTLNLTENGLIINA